MKKIRMDVVLVSLVIGGIVAMSLFCNVKTEGFRNNNSDEHLASDIDYNMTSGVPGVKQLTNTKRSYDSWFNPLAANTGGNQVPLSENELAIFSNNVQSPLCCPSTYSGSDGCVCATPQQMKYLNSRGGNRTSNSLF
tara:strand:+ start:1351 stop:1761 length:411 start_codon:yes stop_codon:yes gene_type:complete